MDIKEIKEKDYISAKDLRKIIPGLGIHAALNIIKETREDMEKKKLFVPQFKPYVALTKMVLERLGL